MTASIKLSDARIAAAFIAACKAELNALKPGNVHRHAPGHGMTVADFETAARTAAPHIANSALSVGQRIEAAVAASFDATGCNTNLGIVLLCAPLAAAAQSTNAAATLYDALETVLADLTVADAEAAYRAIATANPGGLGTTDAADVTKAAPTVTLRAAMQLAAERDRIAAAYANGFAELKTVALPMLARARVTAATESLAITTLHMGLLTKAPDSHVARKFGIAAAHGLQRRAARAASHWTPVATPQSVPFLLQFDAALKAEGLNPGTTADFVVATLFIDRLIAESLPKSGA